MSDANLKKLVSIPNNAWPSDSSGVPSDIIRSGLFKPRKGERVYYTNEPIASISGNHIRYTGEELRVVDDLQVLKFLIDQQKGHDDVEAGFEFKRADAVKQIFGNTSSVYYNMLYESLSRLSKAATLDFLNHDGSALEGVSLIRKFQHMTVDGEIMRVWKVWLEPEVIRLLDFSITPKDTEGLPPQAIKTRDLILSLGTEETVTYDQLRYVILDSKATDQNYRKQFNRISDALIEKGYLHRRIEVDASGKLIFPLTDKGEGKRVDSQLTFSF